MQNTAEDLINMDLHPPSRIRDSYRGQWWINLFKQPQLAKLAKWIHPIYKLGHMIFRCTVKVTVTLCVLCCSQNQGWLFPSLKFSFSGMKHSGCTTPKVTKLQNLVDYNKTMCLC